MLAALLCNLKVRVVRRVEGGGAERRETLIEMRHRFEQEDDDMLEILTLFMQTRGESQWEV